MYLNLRVAARYIVLFFFLMIRRHPRSTQSRSSAASDVYKRQQVRGEFKNATTGVASTAGKFASCFALGAKILKDYYPEFAAEIEAKADAAYQEGVKKPGACQTASVLSPYILSLIHI